MDPKYRQIHQSMVRHIQSGDYPMHERLPGERELAARFGVSVGTVVRALESLTREGWLVRRRGDGTYVSDRPQTGAVTAATGRLTTITFVVPHATNIVENIYLGPIFNALCQVCFQADTPLMVAHAAVAEWAKLPERFPDSAFYLVSPPADSRDALTELWGQQPCVAVGASWGEPVPFPTVDSDNRAGTRRAVEYLLHLGHRRIVLVNGERHSANCRDRQAGYEDALAAWEVSSEASWKIASESSTALSAPARAALSDLLLSRRRPSALFCAGYFLALDVIKLVRQLGLSIPEQVSIIANDDPRSAAHLQPPLTVVRQPLDEIGRHGAALLLALMRGDEVAPREQLPVELVVRNSCAPPGPD